MPDDYTAEDWPLQREAHAINGRCSGCNGRLQHDHQNRCPYIGCRRILRGRHELYDYKKKAGLDHA